MTDNQKHHFLNRLSHEHNEKDDFRTPMYIIDWLKDKMGYMLLDAACSLENRKGPALNIFIDEDKIPLMSPSVEENWIYINPPFDMKSVIKFTEKASQWRSKGWPVAMLLPNKLCSKSYCEKVNIHFDEIYPLGGRINFESPYAVTGGTSMNGCFIGIMKVRERNKFPILKSITLAEIKVKK